MITLDPQAKALLDRMAAMAAGKPTAPSPADNAEWAASGRRMHRGIVALSGTTEIVERIEDRDIQGPGGPIRARLYRPEGCAGQGVLVYFHGGGFVSGDLETHDAPLRAVANRSRTTLIAVDYRRAPEHVYPAAHDDCYAALAWVAMHAPELGIDPNKIVVGGDSAGGTLAVAVALMSRDRHGPKIAAQILIYPNTDLTEERDYSSIKERAPRPSWRADMDRYFKAYVPAGVNRRSGYISPVLAKDLSRLPKTLMILAEADPLFDEGELLASRLEAAGVDVTQRVYPGMIHGFFQMAGVLDAGKALITEVAASLAAL